MKAPPPAQWVVRTLEDAGFETWAVGGAVRDSLMSPLGRGSGGDGLDVGDWDFATRARPHEVQRVFKRTIPIGVDHGTVGVLASDGTMFEVTTFRKDIETDGRHAVVRFSDTIEEDLARRDFTINAIAWHPIRDVLLDPFEGARDIEREVLRTVGDPRDRFREDYLRILRALRFAGRFGFEVDPETWAALGEAVVHLPRLSPERIREELMKVLSAFAAPSAALDLYRTSGALQVLYAELAELDPAIWSASLRVMDILSPHRPLVRLAAYLHGLGVADRDDGHRLAAAILTRLRFSNADTGWVARLVAEGLFPPDLPDRAALRRWLSQVGTDLIPDLTRLWIARSRATLPVGEGAEGGVAVSPKECWRAVRSELANDPPLGIDDLALNGDDLIRMGLRPGPHFKDILNALLDLVLEEPGRNDFERLAGHVDRWIEEGRFPVSGQDKR